MELVDISDELREREEETKENPYISSVTAEFGADKVQHFPGAYLIPQLGELKWDGHIYISGATGAGKSFLIRQIVQGDKKHRKIYLFSMVVDDPSLEGLLLHTYNADTDSLKNSICIFDDYPDRILRDQILETGRHDNTMCIVVNHKHRQWSHTMKPINESKYMILFPSANRGVALNEMKALGLNTNQRLLITKLAQNDGRYLIIHQHAPNACITQKTVVAL
jgi:hypothetical protein